MTIIVPIDLHIKLRASESQDRIMSRSGPKSMSYEMRKSDKRSKSTKITTTYRKLELATQQILKKNIRQHEVLQVELHDSRVPPFIQTSDIITSENSKEDQKLKVGSLLRNNDYDYIISTDGSTLLREGNSSLGPSAAAAIVFKKENMRDPIDVLLSNLGSTSHNYEAELTGLQLSLKYLQDQGICHSRILVVCDCVPAMKATFTNKIPVDFNSYHNEK